MGVHSGSGDMEATVITAALTNVGGATRAVMMTVAEAVERKGLLLLAAKISHKAVAFYLVWFE